MNLSVAEATAIIALLITLLTSGGTAVMFFSGRKGANISSLKTLSETVKVLSAQVLDLQEKRDSDMVHIRELESLLFLCIAGLQTLSSQLLKLNIEPSWLWPDELTEWMKGKT